MAAAAELPRPGVGGSCRDCSKPRYLGKSRCLSCLSKNKRKPNRKQCRDCLKSNDTALTRCSSCVGKIRNQYLQRADGGLCVRCGDVATAGAFCLDHWFRNIGSAYRLSKKNGGIDLLKKIWKEQEGRCAVTGSSLIPGNNASLDHVVPMSKGGETVAGNLRWVTISINRAKADMTHQEFVEMCRAVVSANEFSTVDCATGQEPITRSN